MTFVFYIPFFFHFFSFGMGPRPNQPTLTSSRLDQLHARVERFFFADIQKLRRFWGSEFWGLKLSTLKRSEYIRRWIEWKNLYGQRLHPSNCSLFIIWIGKIRIFFFKRCDYVRFLMRALNNPGVRIWLQNKTCRNPSFNWMAPAVSYARLLPLRRLQARFWDTPLQGGSSQLVSR